MAENAPEYVLQHGPEWDGSILSSYALREEHTHELMTDTLHFVFVELKDFNKKWEDIDNDKERFYFCMRHLHEFDSLPEGFSEGIWAKLARESELAEMPAKVKMKYISNMTTEIDKRAQILYAERRGEEKGRAEGLAESKLAISRKMKADGLSIEMIARYTGLTTEQIAEL